LEIQKDDHSIGAQGWGAKLQPKAIDRDSNQKALFNADIYNSLILLNIYFLPFHQEIFLKQLSKTAAPLHPFNLKFFIINKLSGV
jgi:hypothetical protein